MDCNIDSKSIVAHRGTCAWDFMTGNSLSTHVIIWTVLVMTVNGVCIWRSIPKLDFSGLNLLSHQEIWTWELDLDCWIHWHSLHSSVLCSVHSVLAMERLSTCCIAHWTSTTLSWAALYTSSTNASHAARNQWFCCLRFSTRSTKSAGFQLPFLQCSINATVTCVTATNPRRSEIWSSTSFGELSLMDSRGHRAHLDEQRTSELILWRLTLSTVCCMSRVPAYMGRTWCTRNYDNV